MQYRYDPSDFNCEAFKYARARADTLYPKYRKVYLGDRDDLRQTAMMAVVGITMGGLTPEGGVPEDRLLAAVDKEILAEVKANYRDRLKGSPTQDSLQPLPELVDPDTGLRTVSVAQPEPVSVSEEVEEVLADFRKRLEGILTPKELEFLYQRLALGWSDREILAAWNSAPSLRLGPNPSAALRCRVAAKTPPKPEFDAEKVIVEAVRKLQKYLPPTVVDAVAKLPH